MKKLLAILFAGLLLVVLVFGCGEKEEPMVEEPAVETEMEADTGMVEDTTMMQDTVEAMEGEMEGAAEEETGGY